MKKTVFLLLFSVLLFSCEKEQDVVSIIGQWASMGDVSSVTDTIRFNADNTYIVATHWSLNILDRWLPDGWLSQQNNSPRSVTRSVTITGSWDRQGDYVIFSNRRISMPEPELPPELPDGIKFVDNNSSIDIPVVNLRTVWIIQKLTQDSLTVDSDGTILRYYRQ